MDEKYFDCKDLVKNHDLFSDRVRREKNGDIVFSPKGLEFDIVLKFCPFCRKDIKDHFKG